MKHDQKNRFLILLLTMFFSTSPSIFVQLSAQVASADAARSADPDKLLTMDFVEEDIQNVLRLLAKQNNINLIVTEDISGTVTVHFTKVTLKGALDAILGANGYDYVIQENILIVKLIDTDMEGEVETRVFELDYISAHDVQDPLEDILTNKGKIQVFQRRSKLSESTDDESATEADMLVITDTPDNFQKIDLLISQLDKPTPQVLIGVKFIETVLSDNENLGIDWTAKATLSGGPGTVQSSGLATLGGTTVDGSTSGNQGSGLGVGRIKELSLGILSFQELQMMLELLESSGNSKLLSDPRVTTLDNQRASINVETEVTVIVPTVTTGVQGALATEQAQKITISINLNVLPHVHKNGDITMAVEPIVEAITGYSGPDKDQPIISRRSAETQVRVNNGETIAIGGLIKEDVRQTTKKVPFLGDIPILGRLLFTSSSNETEKSDLLIFITPHIIYDRNKSL